MRNHFKQIARLRVALRSKHPHQAFWRFVSKTAQLLKANGAVDVIAENGLAGADIARKEALHASPQKLRPKIRVLFDACPYGLLKISRQRHLFAYVLTILYMVTDELPQNGGAFGSVTRPLTAS
jgi:hypothetical protein